MSKGNYLSNDTISAMASPTGGAICIFRISGENALPILSKLSGIDALKEWTPRTQYLAKLRAKDGSLIDEVLVSYFKNPKSYTGEDLVEIQAHGGTAVAEKLLYSIFDLGARQALPGEFSFRAVRNGKMDLSQAEAVSDLIAAKNQAAAALALEKMGGTQSALITEISEEIRTLASLAELGIDFADQDVDEVSLPRLKERAETVREKLDRLESSFERGRKIQEGILLAIIGEPNAGKSSFFNALLGEERSIVSEIAGTTRDVVRESITLTGKKTSATFRLEDTAGLRSDTSDTIEKIGIERSLRSAADADLILFVMDPTKAGPSLDALWSSLGNPWDRTIAVISKSDVATPAQIAAADSKVKEFGIRETVSVSSVLGTGIHEAAETITRFSEKWTKRSSGEVLLTRIDHQRATKDAISHLIRAASAKAEDLFAADLRQALLALGPVIGETLPDDILGRIFSRFCIGK